jgi:hypothetical protein
MCIYFDSLRKIQGASIKVGDARPQSAVGEGVIYFKLNDHRFEAKVVILKDWTHDVLLSIEWLRLHNVLNCTLEEEPKLIIAWSLIQQKQSR